jgi:hypothetical protein
MVIVYGGYYSAYSEFLPIDSPPFPYDFLTEEYLGRRRPKIHGPDSYISFHLGSFEFISAQATINFDCCSSCY